MIDLGTKALDTTRLVLRQINKDDYLDVFEWMGDNEVNKFERWETHLNALYSKGYILEVFDYENKKNYQWGIELNKKLIGYVCVINIDDFDEKGVLGYCLNKKYWNNGYTSEAVVKVLEFMFNEVGINRIEACCSINNISSKRVLEKVHMRYEGIAKEYYKSNNGMQDSYLFGLTKKEYKEI